MSAGRPPDPVTLERPWLEAYPPGVPPTYRLPEVAVPRLLDDAVRDFPTAPAVTSDAGNLDHAGLRDGVREVQTALVEAGVGAGDRVLVALPNLASLPVVLLAVWRSGGVAVPLAPHVRRERLLAVAQDADVRAVVAPRRITRAVAEAATAAGRQPVLAFVIDDDRWLFPRRFHRLRRLPTRVLAPLDRRLRPGRPQVAIFGDDPVRLDDHLLGPPGPAEADPGDPAPATPSSHPPDRARPPDPGDLALLVYRAHDDEPHGVEFTHANLVAATFAGRLWIPDVQAGRERVLVADPATGLEPLVLGLLTGLLAAAHVILVDDPDAAALARTIERHQPTLLPVSPRRLAGLLAEGDAARRDLTSLRVILATGGRVDRQLAADVERRTGGARVREGFGLPETGPLTHAQPVYGRVVPGAIGLPVTDVVATVVAPDDPSLPCPPGTPGVLLVHGPQVARGYWRRPEASAARFVDGWVVSDDLVTMDQDGVFHHFGDRAEVVRRDGGLVAPRQVEAVLETHPGVRRAGVVGDPATGDLLAAVVARRRHRPATDELLVHCRAHLDSHEVPDHVILVDDLPETDAGDLARDDLRERLAGPGGDVS